MPSLAPGQTFDRYEIICHIADGGMGEVYHARHTLLGRDVALKLIYPHLTADPVAADRFLREVRSLARLRHPHIVEIVDAGAVGGGRFLALAFLPCGSLASEMQALSGQGRRMSLAGACQMAGQMCDALDVAHQAGYTHRDVKPSNILRRADGDYVLTDFGIAFEEAAARLTHTGWGLGTPAYMPPEQWNGEAVPRSDIYALGVTLFEALSGDGPFRATTPGAFMVKHITEPPPKVVGARPDAPPALVDLVDAMLAKKPGDRPGPAEARDRLAEIGAALRLPTDGEAFTSRATVILPPPAASPKPEGAQPRRVSQPAPVPVTAVLPETPMWPVPLAVSAALPPSERRPVFRLAWVGGALALVAMAVVVGYVATRPPGTSVPAASPTATPELPAAAMPAIPILRVGLPGVPSTLDPQRVSPADAVAASHLRLLYEGLVRYDRDLNPVPGAALSWEYTAQGAELTFILREGLHYSDGSPLNAKRFEDSLIRLVTPGVGDPTFASLLAEIIPGAAGWQEAADREGSADADDARESANEAKRSAEAEVRAAVQALDSAAAPCRDAGQQDCLRLRLRFIKPATWAHALFGVSQFFPARAEDVDAVGADPLLDPAHIVGNGPFRLTDLNPSRGARLAPNPSWRGTASRVVIGLDYLGDASVALEAFRRRELDILPLTVERVEALGTDQTLTPLIEVTAGGCVNGVAMNVKFPPFDDRNFRVALSLAVDRSDVGQRAQPVVGHPALVWIPPGNPVHDPGEGRFAYNPAEARAARSASAYPTADTLPGEAIRFYVRDDDEPAGRARYIADQIRAQLDIPAVVERLEPEGFAQRRDGGELDGMFFQGWCADFPHPRAWLSAYWRSDRYASRWNYVSAALDAVLDEADATLDARQAADLYAKAQKIITGDATMVLLTHTGKAALVQPWVSGLTPTAWDHGFPGEGFPDTIVIDTAARP